MSAAAKQRKSPKAEKPTATALVLRSCNSSMTSHGGFRWPDSGLVEAPDWDDSPRCGNGLHGLLWGAGDASLLNWTPDAKWLVVEVDSSLLIDLDGKVKFPRGVVIHCGDLPAAAKLIAERAPAGTVIVGGTATAGFGGTATAGFGGVVSISWHDGSRYRRRIGVVEDGGLNPNVKYRLNDIGEFVEARVVE